jgi:hypothetical protein
MVVRSGRQIVTVDVFKETYDSLKKNAEYSRQTTKQFINFLLINALTKFDYLNEVSPELSVDSYGDDRVTLKDSKARKLIDVNLKEEGLVCDLDEKKDCEHTKFVLVSPEVTFQMMHHKLEKLRKKMESNKKNQ